MISANRWEHEGSSQSNQLWWILHTVLSALTFRYSVKLWMQDEQYMDHSFKQRVCCLPGPWWLRESSRPGGLYYTLLVDRMFKEERSPQNAEDVGLIVGEFWTHPTSLLKNDPESEVWGNTCRQTVRRPSEINISCSQVQKSNPQIAQSGVF